MNTQGVFPCSCSRCTSLLASRVFQAYACGDTQVFTSREYLELTLLVTSQVSCLKSVSSSACGEFSRACENKLSRLVSVSNMQLLGMYKLFSPFRLCFWLALVVDTQTFCFTCLPVSRMFQFCPCAEHTSFPFSSVLFGKHLW